MNFISAEKDLIIYPKIDNCKIQIPQSINNKYREVYKRFEYQNSNEVFLSNLKDVFILCGDGGVSGTTFILNDKIVDNLTPYFSENNINFNRNKVAKIGSAFVTAQKWGGCNYFHWLLTTLPNFCLSVSLELNYDTLIINSLFRRFILDCYTNVFKINPSKIISLSHCPVVFCNDLKVISSIGYSNNPDRNTVNVLKNTFKNYLSDNCFRRLYIGRKNGVFRKIINEDKIIKILVDKGFEVVYSEELSFLDQIKIYSEAEIVISPHGSGLANTVWCKPKTKILELFSPNYLGLCYWFLGDSCDHDLYYLIGNGECSDVLCWSDVTADIDINIDEFKQTLDFMGV